MKKPLTQTHLNPVSDDYSRRLFLSASESLDVRREKTPQCSFHFKKTPHCNRGVIVLNESLFYVITQSSDGVRNTRRHFHLMRALD